MWFLSTWDTCRPERTIHLFEQMSAIYLPSVRIGRIDGSTLRIALDPQSHRLLTVTADQQPPVPGEAPPKGRPKYLRGTFAVLTVEERR
jgi:hypothetical protein